MSDTNRARFGMIKLYAEISDLDANSTNLLVEHSMCEAPSPEGYRLHTWECVTPGLGESRFIIEYRTDDFLIQNGDRLRSAVLRGFRRAFRLAADQPQISGT